MKLISYIWGRETGNYVTDMNVFEWIYWFNDNIGRNPTVTYVMEIGAAEAQRWQAEGRATILKRNA